MPNKKYLVVVRVVSQHEDYQHHKHVFTVYTTIFSVECYPKKNVYERQHPNPFQFPLIRLSHS